MKASNLVAPAKVTKDVPDLEEAFEEEDDAEIVAEPKEDDEETELKKDKYIKQPKVKKPAAPKKASKKKTSKDDEHDDVESEEEVKPKKGKAKAKPAAKGKGKKWVVGWLNLCRSTQRILPAMTLEAHGCFDITCHMEMIAQWFGI